MNSSTYYPQGGQARATNKTIIEYPLQNSPKAWNKLA